MRISVLVFSVAALWAILGENAHSQVTASIELDERTVNGIDTDTYSSVGDILMVTGNLSAENPTNQNAVLLLNLEWWKPGNRKTSLQISEVPIPIPGPSFLVELPWSSAYGVNPIYPDIIFTIEVRKFGDDRLLSGLSVPFHDGL